MSKYQMILEVVDLCVGTNALFFFFFFFLSEEHFSSETNIRALVSIIAMGSIVTLILPLRWFLFLLPNHTIL